MFKFLVIAAVFGLALAQTSQQHLRGKFERIKVHAATLEGNLEGDSPDRYVSIYLPPSYRTNPGRSYPVVYLLHGFDDTDAQWFGLIPHFVNVPLSMEAALNI